MDLKETLAISGHSGLFKFVSQGRNGIVVESFADKKRSFVPATTKVSSLDDIAVYTSDEEVPLKEVFKTIFEKETGGKAIDAKTASPDNLKKYMEKIMPDYDRDRVYVSDIKKMMSWYNILHEQNLLNFEEDEKESEEEKAEQKNVNDTEKAVKTKATKTKAKPAEKKADNAAKTKTSAATAKKKSPVKK
ncbi:MAG: DUF5606 domain-containing protein [Bacteroidales bacterium]|nr:DUF5606 domain-containing protein [Bacteroidales bacterium]